MDVRHPKRQARRLLRKLKLPSEAGRVLSDPRCWSEIFCVLYFELCDQMLFEHPRKGFRLARLAPQLAAKVSAARCGGNGLRPVELSVRAQALLGGAYRAIGDYPRADVAYRRAQELLDRHPISTVERANVDRRLAILRICQHRYVEALELAKRAIDSYHALERADDLARSLIIRGAARVAVGKHTAGIEDFGEALFLVNPKLVPRVYHSAIHNLAYAITDARIADFDLAAARRHVRRARRCIRNHRRSLPRAKLLWIEGLMFLKAGLGRRGEALLKSARQSFIGLDAPYEIALVSLDLAEIYLLDGRWRELQRLAAETFRLFQGLSADKEALRTLRYWREAVLAQTISDTAIATARQQLHQRLPSWESS